MSQEQREVITVRGHSFEAPALERALEFHTPFSEYGQDPTCFEYWWKLLSFMYDLDNPATFPPLGRNSLNTDDAASVNRYIKTCTDLAGTSIINTKAAASFKPGPNGTTEVTLERFPPRDSMIGFASMWRQLYTEAELGSFINVHNIVGRINSEVGDSAQPERAETLKKWRQVQNRLKATSLKEQVGAKLQGGNRNFIPRHHDLNPQQLVSLYLYGDWIHWGESREDYAAFVADPVMGPMRDISALETMASLSHVYMGFASLLKSAFSGNVLSST
ncbi:hypothetical protein AB0C38_04640 [Amycolatopsis sp. NPDC048633]|uniref:hypothetical protein n=1 Tax=Amycolatopsis sp. NPDC048633 TaxID=3157095 RepID=UPI0033E673DC